MEDWTLLLLNYSGPEVTSISMKTEAACRAIAMKITGKISQCCALCINTSDGRVTWYKDGGEVEGP